MASGEEHSNPFESSHLIGHVQDAEYFDVPKFLAPPDGKIMIPQPLSGEQTLTKAYGPFDFRLTKFMVIEVGVALLIAVVFIWLARRMRAGDAPKGRLWNLLESLLLYVRDEVARPSIGHHDADKFVPLLWTIFFFVLGCNLVGLLPWAGSPTGALATTAALAAVTFVTVVGSGMIKLGPIGFWTGQVPPMDLPWYLAPPLKGMIFVIEVFGLLVKHFVLAVRLLANMMGGHMVLAVMLTFIVATAGHLIFWGVMPASVLGAVALSLLELFVGILQAYIFTFLSALFIGMAVHPH